MIDWFKKSRVGQVVIIAFVAATVTSGIAVWLYESIRIPSLTGQVAFRDDKLNNLKIELKEVQGEKRRANEDAAKAKTISESAKREVESVSEQLRQSQDAHAKILAEYNAAKIEFDRNSNEYLKTEAKILPIEEMVSLISDQEDAAVLLVDKKAKEIQLLGYGMLMQEFESVQSQKPTTIEAFEPFTLRLATVSREHWELRVALERLRIHAIGAILSFYRDMLSDSGQRTPEEFLKQIRQKPPFLGQMLEFSSQFANEKDFAGWNSNATVAVTEFLTTNKYSTVSNRTSNR